MPIAELLAVQLDMQLLLKLSLSVASVLLVSWAYRFYSSRASKAKACLPPATATGDPPADGGSAKTGDPRDGTGCRNRCCMGSAALRPRASLKQAENEQDQQKNSRPLIQSTAAADPTAEDDQTPGRTCPLPVVDAKQQTRQREETENEAAVTEPDTPQTISSSSTGEGEAVVSEMRQVDVASSSNVVFDSSTTLNPPPAPTGESPGPVVVAGANGHHHHRQRPPPTCFLQRMDRSVGVGRELRQDVDHQGAHSSFLSTAEVKVDDANLVLERTGGSDPEQVVRGKIYDYFVESSSHSVSDSAPMFRHYERTPSPDFKYQSPILMRDLQEKSAMEEPPLSRATPPPPPPPPPPTPPPPPPTPPPPPPTPPERGPPAKPALLRKESYLSATEQHSQLPIPCLAPGASTPGSSPSQTSPCAQPPSANAGIISIPVMNAAVEGRRSREEPGLETLAGASFLHLPAKSSLNSADLEALQSKLDLGNCMAALSLAKVYGHEALKTAALAVMSDNYLQVLREPALYGRLMACERELIQKRRTRGRRFVMAADMDPQDCAGREAENPSGRRTSSLYYYDDYKDTWNALCPIPPEVVSKGCALCTMDNYLFVAVGCQGTDREMIPSKRVFCFNPVTSIWTEISPMNQARPHCKLAAAAGFVYAIGGECLSTMERYDPRADRWTFVAPLPGDTFAVGHHAATCHGEIYVTGGILRYALLRYSPDADAWMPGAVVGGGDRTADLVAARSFVYRFEVNPRLGISVYRYHAVARLWYMCGSKRLAECPAFRCVAAGDSIYCVGRRFAAKFAADDVSPAFCREPMSALSAAKGALFPFVLSLPDTEAVQTSV